MIEALIALCLAVLCVFAFQGPAFLLRLSNVGGVGFVIYALILVVLWLFGRLRRTPPAS